MKYAAIIDKSYHVEGDERSRTNPGHGYPAHDVSYKEFKPFGSKEEMEEWVLSEESMVFNKAKYKIIQYGEMVVSSTIKVEVKVK